MRHIDVEVQLDLRLVRISGFYGNPETSNRWASWELLRRIAASVEGPWITFGDFNELRDASEKKGGSDRIESQMQKFVEAIDDCGLQDVEVSGPLFTWRRGDLLERLDRSLINQEAAEMFPRIHELHIDVGASDHIPILIYTDGLPAKKCDKRQEHRRFLFEGFWTKEANCVRWSRDTIGNIPRQINRMTSELQSLPFDSTNSEVVERRISVVAELQKLMWRQKSRIDWLSEGDQNTKFFHGYAKARGRRNRVGRIMNAAGEWQETSEGIKEAFISYFQNIFASQGCNHMELVLDAIPQKISDAMNNRLCQPYGRGEIEQALKQMAPDKAPKEDGFSARFFQEYWSVVGDDVSDLCLRVLNEGAELTGINHTLIALIPKVENPQQVPDFRPISLCNVIYKLISKAIVNRLKGVLPDVISQFQSAFVPGRCIHDNVITAFELVHSIKTRQTGDQPHCVLKLDISKAYDRVEWVFLQGVLTKFGFDEKLVELIMRCVRSVSFSILWNGEAVGLINPTRGLRQDDPLSPYLFLMVSEGLTGLLQKADREGMIHGVKAAVDAPIISHLLFVDDSLLFGRAEIHEAIRVKQCLLLYESAAGQKINFQKSAIAFGPGLDDQTKLEITQMLGVPMVDCHEKYLGLPTIAGRNKKGMFKRINERLDFHLQGWQSKLLSKAGKFVLVKAVAQAIPTYSMSVFKLPKGVCCKFQSKVAKFWWVKKGNKRGIHWCKWDLLCRNKKEGGLGFRDLEGFNQALLAKTVWRIVLHPDSIINRVLHAKYVRNGDWAAAGVGVKPSFVWRGLVWGKDLLCAGIRWRIGSGDLVKIWGDKWLPTPWSFKVVTPCFMDPNARVSQLMSQPGMWDMNFIKQHFLPVDVEKILVVPLCDGNGGDVVVWHFSDDGRFSVKSGYWFGMEMKRNEVFHGKKGLEPRQIVEKCLEWQREFSGVMLRRKNLQMGGGNGAEVQQSDGEVGRSSTHEQAAKLFFDGACDNNTNIIGIGAVVLSANGELMGAISVPMEAVLKPHIIEALALWHGMKLCRQMGVTKLAIAGDAVNVINAIGRNVLDLSDIGGIMDAVRWMKAEFEWVSWKHVRKRQNGIAHTLARHALKMVQSMFCYDSGPPWLHEVIVAHSRS
ncbi:hypothetical protein ACLB2K_053563 [Fragaria x ananassa]